MRQKSLGEKMHLKGGTKRVWAKCPVRLGIMLGLLFRAKWTMKFIIGQLAIIVRLNVLFFGQKKKLIS